jgi:hypothetical protein
MVIWGISMGNIWGGGDNLTEVGIEPGTIAYNARCYNHYTMVACPYRTISGSRSYPKKVLADILLQRFISNRHYWIASWHSFQLTRRNPGFESDQRQNLNFFQLFCNFSQNLRLHSRKGRSEREYRFEFILNKPSDIPTGYCHGRRQQCAHRSDVTPCQSSINGVDTVLYE